MIYVDLSDHMVVLPVPGDTIRVLESLGVKAKESAHEMKGESLETAKRLADKKLSS